MNAPGTSNNRKWMGRLSVFFSRLLLLTAGAFWYLHGINSPPVAASGGMPLRDFTLLAMPLTPVSSYGSDIYAVRIVEPGNSKEIKQ